MGLLLPRRFGPGTLLAVELQAAPPSTPQHRLLLVVHVDGLGKDRWRIGGTLYTEFSPEEIDDLRHDPPA